ncbi:hypothetical protein GCM10023185_31000 [Hymenobacter saemangeumensis]|uniref:Virion structural protein n=1 Tax=Hymenobacter saemangeumensis TaxID=1084522 RepID=A0ABP8ILT9_9BACT
MPVTRTQLKALFRQFIKVVAGGPADKTRGGGLISVLDEFVDSVIVPADLPALLATNKLRGTDKIVPNMVLRGQLETAGVLTVGTSCYVQNSANVADFLAGVIEPPKIYLVSQNSTLVAPAGFLAYIDGSNDPTTVRCEWVEANSFAGAVAGYPYLDRTQAAAAGYEAKYRGTDNVLRLFRVLQPLVPAGGPPALIPAPPDGGNNANYEEFSPGAGLTYTDQQAMIAAFTERFHTTTRQALLDLFADGQTPSPGRVYRITDANGGTVTGMFATSAAPFIMEGATRAGQTGLWQYNLTANTYTASSGGGGGTWGSITGLLADQSDLANALAAKEATANKATDLSDSSSNTKYPSVKAVRDFYVSRDPYAIKDNATVTGAVLAATWSNGEVVTLTSAMTTGVYAGDSFINGAYIYTYRPGGSGTLTWVRSIKS